jgi:hypothetical protein
MAWQMAQQMELELAPGGSCKGVWQFEQLTNMYMLFMSLRDAEMSELKN